MPVVFVPDATSPASYHLNFVHARLIFPRYLFPNNLFEIYILVLGISMVFIDLLDSVSTVKQLLHNKGLRESFSHGLPSGVKLLMQIFEVLAGDMGIYLSR